jgi:hypothetical protein
MERPIIFNGKTYTLRPRAARMVATLVDLQEDLERIPFGRLVLHFAGRMIKPELTQSYRPQAVDPDQADDR